MYKPAFQREVGDREMNIREKRGQIILDSRSKRELAWGIYRGEEEPLGAPKVKILIGI